ncbi:MAG: hypothetical protein QNJ47_25965 [Nostocaceae cyanobacterium]|nr:hypothetical protein [Nostocaceae cyanobacterium]
MIGILVDADLILEALINRTGLVEDFQEFLDEVHPLIHMHVTDVGWQKIYTYTSCLKNHQIADVVIDWLKDKIQICPVNLTILQQARFSPIQDFESAVEAVSASYYKLDAIVTHKYDNFAEITHQFWIWSAEELWVRANLESQFKATRYS